MQMLQTYGTMSMAYRVYLSDYLPLDISTTAAYLSIGANQGLGSIRGVFGPMSKISFTLSNYRFVIWDKNYRRYFVI